MKAVGFGGGLGGQIFSAVVVEHLRLKEGPESATGDTSYFRQTPRPAGRGEGITIYRWELDYYGLPVTRYGGMAPMINSRLARRFGLGKIHRLEDGSLERAAILRDAMKTDWSATFPIREDHEREARRLLSDGGLPTAVVHLRRGDYLNVATHVVGDGEVTPLLRKLALLGIRRFLFASDDAVPLDAFREQVPAVSEWREIPPEDAFLTHAVMRGADCLVTSNSQFSLSAALLNPRGVTFSPRVWFGGSLAALDAEFNQFFDWMVR